MHGDIPNDTESLTSIYKLIRSYYNFAPSESTFLKFETIKRERNETELKRPQHLYLRLRQFIRDNLLKNDSNIQHDGKVPKNDESMSPTTERLIVPRWLELLHPALPQHVANVFNHDLQSKSLKDLQPQIVSQIEHLSSDVGKKDHFDSHIGLTHSFAEDANVKHINPSRYFPQTHQIRRPSNNLSRFNSYRNFQYGKRTSLPPLTIKKCTICKAVGEPFIANDTSQCPNITPHDRQKFVKSHCLDTESDEIPSEYGKQMQNETSTPISQQIGLCIKSMNNASLSRMQVLKSPEVTLYYNDFPLQLTIDTGATASIISLPISKAANISIMPAVQKAIQVDGHTELPVVGEIDVLLQHENVPSMRLNALAVQN